MTAQFISQSVLAQRRLDLMSHLGAGALILPGARLKNRNSDVSHTFRQCSDFFYLTGFDEPDSCLLLTWDGSENPKVTLFVPPKNKEKEIWDGYREGAEGVCSSYGADQGFANDELEARLFQLLEGHKVLFYDFDRDSATDATVMAVLKKFKTLKRKNPVYPRTIRFFREELGCMRQIKSAAEIELVKQCALVSKKAHIEVMKRLKPGMFEYEVEAILEYEYKRHGGTHGYGHIVAGGANATCLHYHDNNQVLHENDLLLIDSGCELPHKFTSDVTRCYPVNGRFSKDAALIYNLVLMANHEAIAACVPGASIREVHLKAQTVLAAGLVELGVLKGDAQALVENGELGKFYMHGTSHWLGMDVHDAGLYDNVDGSAVKFRPGMMLTIEPGLYFRSEYSGVNTRFDGIGVRIEDNILITSAGPVNLTADIPKEISEIEAIMGGGKGS